MPKFIGEYAAADRIGWLAEQLAGRPDGKSVKALAEECGVHTDTVYRDLKSDEFHLAVKKRIRGMASGQGIAQAFKNVMRDINKGNVQTSKWLLDRLGVFDGETDGTTKDAVLDALKNGHKQEASDDTEETGRSAEGKLEG